MMKYYYDGMTPYEEYPIDFDIECYNCKYEFECYSNDNLDTVESNRCLKEQLEHGKMEYNCAKCLCSDCKYRGKDGCGDSGVCKECKGQHITVRYCPYYEERDEDGKM